MEPLRVLITEDKSLTRTTLRARLEKLGHQVVAEAENGLQAIEAARAMPPDVIIMDKGIRNNDGPAQHDGTGRLQLYPLQSPQSE